MSLTPISEGKTLNGEYQHERHKQGKEKKCWKKGRVNNRLNHWGGEKKLLPLIRITRGV